MQKNNTNNIDGITAIIDNMNEELANVTPANKIQRAYLCFHLVHQAAAALKNLAHTYAFKSQVEEIAFYKITYTGILEDRYYYAMQYELEAHSPYKRITQQAYYLQSCLARFKDDLEKQNSFYNYDYLDESYLDTKYFTRNSDMPMPPDLTIGIDEYSCPAVYYANKFAKVRALVRVICEVVQELMTLNDAPAPDSGKFDQKLVWTGTKIELIELVYALFERGCINKGQVTLKRIIGEFEAFFNTRLDNYLTLFKQSIRMRKETRTIFLEALISGLTERMDKFDEKKSRI